MKRRRICLWIETGLCVLLASVLAAGAIRICAEGTALRAAGDAAAPFYTMDRVAWMLTPALPLALLVLGMGILCRLSGGAETRESRPRGPKPDCAILKRRENVKRLQAVRAILVLLAAGLILHGITNGSMLAVWIKATHICMECIGIG